MAITSLPPADYDAIPTAPSAADPYSSVATYSDIQSAALPSLTPIGYCNKPELFLSEAATEYIPQHCYEDSDSYEIRLSSALSSFQPFYKSLKELTIGTALRKPIQLSDEQSSEGWESFFRNCTLEGDSLTVFSKRLLDASIDTGVAGILIDFPRNVQAENLAQERAQKLRPYFQLINFSDILGWKSEIATTQIGETTEYGNRLTQLRIKDSVSESDPLDEFVLISRPAVHVFDQLSPEEPVRHRLFVSKPLSKGSPDKWCLEEETILSIPFIPFVPVYSNVCEGFMRARPLLLDIARLNLKHWQVSADLAHSLHLTSTPSLVISGVNAMGENGDLQVSPDRSLILADPQSRADWIGAPSDGADVMRENLKDLEHAMMTLSPVQKQEKTTTGVESAAAKKMDRAQSDAVLSLLVSNLEDSLNQALAIAAVYWNTDPVLLDLPRDFVPQELPAAEIKEYAALVATNLLSHETFLRKLHAAEVFDGLDSWSVEEELDLLAQAEPTIDPLLLPEEEMPEDADEEQANDQEDISANDPDPVDENQDQSFGNSAS